MTDESDSSDSPDSLDSPNHSDSPDGINFDTSSDVCLDVIERVEEAVVVDREVLVQILGAILARGHVLLEDVPGTGKSVTARVFAEALGLEFNRLQFTPDLLPADVTGSNVYNEQEREFEFAQGPVFSNVVLADEINRAPPKTQAALLEAMEERQVSVDGTTHDLPEPFFVIATQNPVEQEGTFRLPEAQRDRFSVKTSVGYPEPDGEMGLLERRSNRRTLSPSVDSIVGPETVGELQELAEDVTVEETVRRYIIDIARQTRSDPRTEIGVSPRGVQRVFEIARSIAVIAGRDYVTPDDVKRLAGPAMAHRVVLTTEATVEGVEPKAVVRDAVDAIEVPAVAPDATPAETPDSTGAGPQQAADAGSSQSQGTGDLSQRAHPGDSRQGQSQRGQSPQGQSQRGQSPQGQSQRGQSSQGQSPQGQSPQGQPPRGESHRGQPNQHERRENQDAPQRNRSDSNHQQGGQRRRNESRQPRENSGSGQPSSRGGQGDRSQSDTNQHGAGRRDEDRTPDRSDDERDE